MATSRPFAYNTGSPIGGTDQVGDLAIGYPTEGFESTGLQWWSGPDEDPGYVIAKPVALNSQPTPVPEDAITLSTIYKGSDITLSNNNQTANQVFSYSQTALGETLISGTDKVMFSVQYTSTNPSVGAGGHFIGVGLTGMNYSGPFNGYPGNDTNSIGFSDDGNYYFNGSSVQSGLPTWTSGDIIDIAISHGEYWWIRVNGGDWNNNPTANPTAPSGGLLMNGQINYYPALCPYIYGTMQALNYPKHGVPSDYNFLGNVSASVGFSRTSTLSESEFVDLANNLTGYSQNFTTGDQANIWLNANGYWTSYAGATGSTGATGGFSITISEVGSNVVMTASGTLNINDLTLISSGTGPFGGGGLGVNSATFVLGSTPSYFDEYSGFTTTPSNFGTGGGLGSSSSTGDIMGVIYQGAPPYHLVVPSGYTSGTYITGSQTFNTQTFNSLGLTVGTYTYTWGSGPNADSINVVVGGTGSTGSTGGATGAGWYFYAPEGPLVDGPPTSDGQAIFTDNLPAGGTDVTFNPNKSGGVNFLNFNLSDVDGVDYTTQFTNLQNSGGTVSVTQNGDTATYVLTTGMAFVNSGLGFVAINTAAATQTVNASGSFVSGSPITISFS